MQLAHFSVTRLQAPTHCDLVTPLPIEGEKNELALVETPESGLSSDVEDDGDIAPDEAVDSCEALVLRPKLRGLGGDLLLEGDALELRGGFGNATVGVLLCSSLAADVGDDDTVAGAE